MPINRKYKPESIPDQVAGPFPLKIVRLNFQELWRLIKSPGLLIPPGVGSGGTGGTGGSGGGGSGGGGGTTLATREVIQWKANGPYRADTDVDGWWTVTTPCEVYRLRLSRTTPGTSGSTVVDLNRIPAGAGGDKTSMYTTQANRPRIAYTQTDEVACTLPDVVALVAGDRVGIDIDEAERGPREGLALTLEVA